jgi:hypothetical protein
MQPALLLQVFWSTTGQVFRDYLREQRLNFRFIPQHNQYLECKVAPGSSNQDGCVPDLSRRGFSVETLDALEGVLHRASQAALSLVRSIKCNQSVVCCSHAWWMLKSHVLSTRQSQPTKAISDEGKPAAQDQGDRFVAEQNGCTRISHERSHWNLSVKIGKE